MRHECPSSSSRAAAPASSNEAVGCCDRSLGRTRTDTSRCIEPGRCYLPPLQSLERGWPNAGGEAARSAQHLECADGVDHNPPLQFLERGWPKTGGEAARSAQHLKCADDIDHHPPLQFLERGWPKAGGEAARSAQHLECADDVERHPPLQSLERGW